MGCDHRDHSPEELAAVSFERLDDWKPHAHLRCQRCNVCRHLERDLRRPGHTAPRDGAHHGHRARRWQVDRGVPVKKDDEYRYEADAAVLSGHFHEHFCRRNAEMPLSPLLKLILNNWNTASEEFMADWAVKMGDGEKSSYFGVFSIARNTNNDKINRRRRNASEQLHLID